MTWHADLGADNAQTTAFIAAFDSDKAEDTGWDDVVKAGLTFAHVTRTSATVATVVMPAFSGFAITATETITPTIPASIVTGQGDALVASPLITVTNVAEAIALTGTATSSMQVEDVVNGGRTLIFTVTGDQFVATLGDNNAITTAFLAAITSEQSEATGWNAVVVLTHAMLTRDSATQCTLVLPAAATYDITVGETVRATPPATSLLASSGSIVASPIFTVSVVVGWFVASDASGGDGTIDSPWTLAEALAHPGTLVAGEKTTTVQDGDGGTKDATIIWLRAGTYGSGTEYEPALTGTAINPIVVRAYPGERAIIDGWFKMDSCPYTWWWDFEQTWTGSFATVIPNASEVNATGVRHINILIHDFPGVGVYTGSGAVGHRIHGCPIYNCGMRDDISAASAHGIYTQNIAGTRKIFSDNFSFNHSGKHYNNYTESGSMRDQTWDGNVAFSWGDGFTLRGRTDPVDGHIITNNMIYQQDTDQAFWELIGDYDGGGTASELEFTDNYSYGINPLWQYWDTLTLTGNTFLRGNTISYDTEQSSAPAVWNIDNNDYYGRTGVAPERPNFKLWFEKRGSGGTRWTPAQWLAATPYDDNSDFYLTAGGKPTTNKVFVRANAYDLDRGNIIIYNWEGLANVDVDVSSVLANGDTYEVLHVHDFYGTPLVTGTLSGGTVTIPTTAVAPPEPSVGWQGYEPDSLGIEFLPLVIRKT